MTVVSDLKFSREWAMPTPDTFDCEPINGFVKKYLINAKVSVDPFSRNKRWCSFTNDLNPNTAADSHKDGVEFLVSLSARNIVADLVILDPPYSPRQISECYKEIGITVSMEDTQSGKFNKRLRDATLAICRPGTVVLSFGWNTVGMGAGRGFGILEILLVCHGGGLITTRFAWLKFFKRIINTIFFTH